MNRDPVQHVQASVFKQKYPFVKNVINFESYFEEYGESIRSSLQLNPDKLNTRNVKKSRDNLNNFFKSQLDVNDTQIKELMNITNVDNLTCEGELQPSSIDSSYFKISHFKKKNERPIPENNLETLKKETEKKKKEFPLKYFMYRVIPPVNQQNWTINMNPFDFDNIILCVKVYCPFSSSRNTFARVKLLQEIHLLGNQFLFDLKDKIECNMDYMGFKDVSNDYFLTGVGYKKMAKEIYLSSFIFIEDTFYEDSRVQSENNSQVIKDWADKRNMGPFRISTMGEKPLTEIPLRLGFPYVYQHQGNCEHIVTFSDARLINSCDPLRTRCYPHVHAIGSSYVKHCIMCNGFAKWLVMKNKRLTHDRSFLCNNCYKSYNYKDGVKIGDFKAYDYVDPVAIL